MLKKKNGRPIKKEVKKLVSAEKLDVRITPGGGNHGPGILLGHG